MFRRPTPRRAVGLLILVTVLLGGTPVLGCDAGGNTDPIRILASWVDNPDVDNDERDAFVAVLDQFHAETGITVEYQGTRDITQALRSVTDEGEPPDVVVLPSAGDLSDVGQRDSTRSLDDLVGAATASHRVLRRADTNQAYAVAIKTTVKSLIWYDPTRYPAGKSSPPGTWDQLLSLSRESASSGTAAWCVGVAATPNSGWPGTDWIEDLLLKRYGTRTYADWASGKLAWTSPEVRQAWSDWAQIVLAPGMMTGGGAAALLTDFGVAGRPMYGEQPCLLHHQGSFMATLYPQYDRDGQKLRSGTDFDFFQFPGSDGLDLSADFAAQLTDRPEAHRLIRYLLSKHAQQVWAGASQGNIFLAGVSIDHSQFGSVVTRLGQVLDNSVGCLDASNAMPAPMASAFQQAVLDFLNDPNRLDTLLGQLDAIRTSVAPDTWLTISCGK